MGVITSIEPVSKTKYRVSIDGRFAFVLHKGELLHYGLEEDLEISDEIREEIIEEVVYKEAKAYVNKVLTAADKTVKEIRDGMRRKEFPEPVIERVIELCRKHRLLDDHRYAEQYISGYATRKSTRLIRMELQNKGISEDIVQEILDKQDTGEQELEAVLRLLKKKWPDREERTYEDMQKLTAFFLRKGFSYEIVRRGIRCYTDGESDI